MQKDGHIVFEISELDLKIIVQIFLRMIPFDDAEYLRSSSDLARAMADGRYLDSAQTHFVYDGYFEGRRPFPAFLTGTFDEIAAEAQLSDEYYKQLYNASVAVEASRYGDAEDLLVSILDQYPPSTRALRLAANCCSRRGRPRRAHLLLSAIPAKHLSAPDFKVFGLSCRALHLFDDSLLYLQRALDVIGGTDSLLVGYLAALHLQSGTLRDARRTFARMNLAQLGGDGTASFARVRRLSEHARTRLRVLIRQQRNLPSDISDQIELIYQLARLGFKETANRRLNTAVRMLRPFQDISIETVYYLTEAARLCRGPNGALNAYRLLQLDNSVASVVIRECQLLYLARQYDACLDRLVNLNSTTWSGDAFQVAFNSALMLGRTSYALEICAAWREFLPDSVNWMPSAMTALFEVGTLSDVQINTTAGAQTNAAPIGRGVVPATIIQYWNDKDIPEDVLDCMESWERNNPSYSYIRFDDASAADFLQNEFGITAYAAFQKCTNPAMKADYLRLGYLYKFGGCYIDADERSIVPLSQAMENLEEKTLIVVRNQRMTLFNSPILCVPNHLIIGRAFERASRGLLDVADNQEPINVWQTTGPGLLTQVFLESILAGDEGVIRDTALISEWDSHRFAREETFKYKASPSRNWRLS